MTIKHTPTPWKLGGTHRSTQGRVIVSTTAPFEIVAEAYDFNKYDRDAEKESNAALIVRAVNAHAELVKALERAYAIEFSVTQGQETELREGYRDMLKAALAKARA